MEFKINIDDDFIARSIEKEISENIKSKVSAHVKKYIALNLDRQKLGGIINENALDILRKDASIKAKFTDVIKEKIEMYGFRKEIDYLLNSIKEDISKNP